LQRLASLSDKEDVYTYARLLNATEDANTFCCQPVLAALAGMPKGKHAFEVAIGNLATYAAQSERPSRDLRDLASNDLFSKSPADVIQFLWSETRSPSTEFTFVVSVVGSWSDVKSVVRGAPGLQLLPKRRRPPGSESTNYFSAREGCSY